MFRACGCSEHRSWYVKEQDRRKVEVDVPNCMERHLSQKHQFRVRSAAHPGRRRVANPFIPLFDPLEDTFKLLRAVCRPDILQILEAGDFKALEECDEDTEHLWKQTCGFLPQKLEAASCWERLVPTELGVYEAVQGMKAYQIVRNGVVEERARKPTDVIYYVLRDIAHPDLVAIGRESPKPVPGGRLRVPGTSLLNAFDTTTPIFNITPKGSIVDLHIDNGTESISATIEKCTKVWCMWPSSSANLELFEEVKNLPFKLSRISSRLQKGVLFASDSSQAVIIPPGCIHGTLTLTGGFLASAEFLSPYTVGPAAECLRRGLFGPLHYQYDRDCMYLFISAFEIALQNGRPQQALASWDVARKPLEVAVSRDNALKTAARGVWERFFGGVDTPERCPCGRHDENTPLAEHAKEIHCSYLY